MTAAAVIMIGVLLAVFFHRPTPTERCHDCRRPATGLYVPPPLGFRRGLLDAAVRVCRRCGDNRLSGGPVHVPWSV